jgi:tetratricopeptide (TPR) repeat protein
MVLGRWAEARALYHVIQERYAASAWSQIAAVREAISQRALGDQEAAVARLEQLLEEALAPAMAAEAQIELARAAIEQEAWDRAVARLEAARTLDAAARTQADVLFWSGWIAMRQAQWSQALGAWNELHTQYPGSARDEACWPWRLVAVTHVKGVAVALDVLATWHEERAAAQVLRMAQTVASTLADDGLASEAIQVYIFLADHAPVEARAAWYFHLGELYQEQRQVEDAIAMYQRAMREEARGPLASRSALAAARLLENSQRSDQAVALYRHVASMPGQASRVALERLEQLRHAADDR